jgi:copper homeostasis protein
LDNPSVAPAPQSAPRRFLLEVAVAGVEDALAAAAGGADRLELNAALSLGGLTPSLGTLLEVRQATSLPVFVMLRPRPGAFCYRPAEYRVLLRDLDLLLSHGAAGIVFGILNEDATIDRTRCSEVVRQAGNHPVVFHRAFDLTPDPTEALELLIDLGVRRVMTSGQQAKALAGAARIAALVGRATGRIEILPAGGINDGNVVELLERTGCDQIHGGLRASGRDPSALGRPDLTFSTSPLPPELFELTDGSLVKRLRETMDKLGASGDESR